MFLKKYLGIKQNLGIFIIEKDGKETEQRACTVI